MLHFFNFIFYGVNNTEHVQSKNQVVILGISIFEKWNRTVESNRLADRVRKKRPPSYLAVAAKTSSFILYFYALDMSSQKMELI